MKFEAMTTRRKNLETLMSNLSQYVLKLLAWLANFVMKKKDHFMCVADKREENHFRNSQGILKKICMFNIW